MCIVTVMNHGLRNGGGVGDILRKPSKDVSTRPAHIHGAQALARQQLRGSCPRVSARQSSLVPQSQY